MPLYEYECTKCGKRTELLQRFDDEPLAECPECGGPVRKLVSAPAVQFKGTGWYVTDYSKPSGRSESSDTKSDTGSSSKTSAAPDAKTGASEAKKSGKSGD